MRIGVLCSGGDAPGMNACTRAVVRTALAHGHEVVGIRRGYQGLLDEDFFLNVAGQPLMTLRSVADWVRHGGTYLHSSRSKEFRSDAGRTKAAENLRRNSIDALIPIGGDGTFHGAVALADVWNGKIVGCPGTIDNDLLGTDYTIGFSTAVRTAVQALDMLRDTAESHERMFLIEVMGRHSGYIAVHTALAGAAETVCVPETPTDIRAIVAGLHKLKARGKSSIMMIVAEGDEEGGAHDLYERLKETDCPFSMRVLILGHLQRGGSPTPEDRLLACQLGDGAVRAVMRGETGVMVGVQGGKCTLTPFADTFAHHRPIPAELLALVDMLAH